jgi:TupA-like ATPgrasp
MTVFPGPPVPAPPQAPPASTVLRGAALWQHRFGQRWERLRRMRPLLGIARRVGRHLPDRLYLALGHALYFGRWPDYDAPSTFMEHVQAHMLQCRDPLLHVAADKLASRAHIAAQVGGRYLVPGLGSWDRSEDVPLLQLPRPYVIKPTAASGLVQIVRAGQAVDEAGLRRRMAHWLRVDHQAMHREWAYRGLSNRLLAEVMLQDEAGQSLPDCKAYVIGGQVRFIQIDRGRFTHHTRNLYSPDWALLPVRLSLDNHAVDPKPACLDELLAVAERLAEPFEFLRVDTYIDGDRLYVGELTNYPGAGFERFMPASFDAELNQYWPQR